MEQPPEPPYPPFPARLAFWLLLLVVALAPLPFASNRPWAWSLLSMCVGSLLMMWGVCAFFNSNTVQLSWGRYRPLFILFAVFIGWSFYQAVGFAPESWWAPGWRELSDALHAPAAGTISVDPERSLTGVMRLLSYAGIFWLAMQVGRRTRYAKLALWSIVLAGAAYAIYGLIVQLEGSNSILWFSKWTYRESLTSTFVNRNHFAIYSGLSILCTLALIADEARQATEASIATRSGLIQLLDNMSVQMVVLSITFMVLGTALILTQSRSGVFITSVAIMVFLGALATTHTFAATSVARFGLVILIAGGIFVVVSGSMLAARMSEVTENAADRLAIYGATIRAIADRPLLGFGLGAFASVIPRYRGAEFTANGAAYDYAHNIYLELALESGIPVALLLLAAVAIVVGVCMWGARHRHRNGFFSALGVAATALVGLHGLVDFSLQIPAIAAAYCLVLGVAYSQAWRTGGPEEIGR